MMAGLWLRRYRWLVWAGVYALVGVLTFPLEAPGATALPVQFAGYLTAGVAMLVWAVLDYAPVAKRWRGRALPFILCIVAAAGGLAATAGFNENNCPVTLASLAATVAAVELRRWQAWLVVVCSAVTIDLNAFIFHDGFDTLSTFLLYPFVPLTGLLLGHFVRTRQEQGEQAAALLARTQQLQAEQSRTEVLNERARIAREIHDVLAHSLGALSIQIQAARAVLTDQQDIDRALEVLSTAQRMASDGLTETRRAVHALRSDAVPLDQELSQAARIHRERYGADVAFTVGGQSRILPPDATVALLRTAQEALVNAAKHAPGQRVSVRLDYGGDDVSLTVVNDLPGDGPAPGAEVPCPHTVDGGYGLTGMRERLRLLHGTLVAGPQGGHWVVAAGLPLALPSPSVPAGSPHPAALVAS
ncbi:MAG TPA: sensor histidine kinase [Streptosporangiaceae bacterium]|nr:sensor histidine kinase [Streptosporangiaceae bacterium]